MKNGYFHGIWWRALLRKIAHIRETAHIREIEILTLRVFKGFNQISRAFVLTKVVCIVMDYNRVKFHGGHF